jgi:hypothetical protein
VAEGGGLLNRYTVKSCIGGSNPPLSASLLTSFRSGIRKRRFVKARLQITGDGAFSGIQQVLVASRKYSCCTSDAIPFCWCHKSERRTTTIRICECATD